MDSLFITLEGLDGSGKSLQAQAVEKYLQSCGLRVVRFRAPGSTMEAERIRQFLVDPIYHFDATTECLLHLAAINELYQKMIRPALRNGFVVICDRFFDSTIAYQGVQASNMKNIQLIAKSVFGEIEPNLTFLLDISPEISSSRASQRREQDRYDLMNDDFKHQVRSNYHTLAANFPDRWILVDAAQSASCVTNEICYQLALKTGLVPPGSFTTELISD